MLDLDSRTFPPRLGGVEVMANRLVADYNVPQVGRGASNFVKRHQELKRILYVRMTINIRGLSAKIQT